MKSPKKDTQLRSQLEKSSMPRPGKGLFRQLRVGRMGTFIRLRCVLTCGLVDHLSREPSNSLEFGDLFWIVNILAPRPV